jgi:hypothetical protein
MGDVSGERVVWNGRGGVGGWGEKEHAWMLQMNGEGEGRCDQCVHLHT